MNGLSSGSDSRTDVYLSPSSSSRSVIYEIKESRIVNVTKTVKKEDVQTQSTFIPTPPPAYYVRTPRKIENNL